MQPSAVKKFGPIVLATAKIVFGTLAIFLKLAPTPIILLLLAQSFFGAVGFFPAARNHIRQLHRRDIVFIFLVTFAFLLNSLTFFFAVRMMDVSIATLLRWVAPILLAGIVFVSGEHRRPQIVGAVIVGFIGLFLVMNGKGVSYESTNAIGSMLSLLSATAVALYWYSSKIALRRISAPVLLWLRAMIALPILSGIALGFFWKDLQFSWESLPYLVLFGLIYGIMAAYLDVYGIKHTSAEYIGMIGYIEPLTSLFGAVIILQETFSWSMVIGGIVILGSGYWIQRIQRRVIPKIVLD